MSVTSVGPADLSHSFIRHSDFTHLTSLYPGPVTEESPWPSRWGRIIQARFPNRKLSPRIERRRCETANPEIALCGSPPLCSHAGGRAVTLTPPPDAEARATSRSLSRAGLPAVSTPPGPPAPPPRLDTSLWAHLKTSADRWHLLLLKGSDARDRAETGLGHGLHGRPHRAATRKACRPGTSRRCGHGITPGDQCGTACALVAEL